jgi:hypothetical protein
MMQRVIERSKPKAEIFQSVTREFFTEHDVDKAVIEIRKVSSGRTIPQNRLYRMWCTLIGNELGYDNEECHDALAEKFLGTKPVTTIDGRQLEKICSTSTLKVSEFTDYLERIDRFCASELSIVLPRPEDLYYTAMGIEPPKYAD